MNCSALALFLALVFCASSGHCWRQNSRPELPLDWASVGVLMYIKLFCSKRHSSVCEKYSMLKTEWRHSFSVLLWEKLVMESAPGRTVNTHAPGFSFNNTDIVSSSPWFSPLYCWVNLLRVCKIKIPQPLSAVKWSSQLTHFYVSWTFLPCALMWDHKY